VSVMQATPEVILLMADTRAKYPDVGCYGDREVMVGKGERTLRAEEGVDSDTIIRINGLRGRWHTQADAGRYTVMISLVKEEKNRKKLEALDWYDKR
jgi:hypothetical protein